MHVVTLLYVQLRDIVKGKIFFWRFLETQWEESKCAADLPDYSLGFFCGLLYHIYPNFLAQLNGKSYICTKDLAEMSFLNFW